jgi:hypothetical protein
MFADYFMEKKALDSSEDTAQKRREIYEGIVSQQNSQQRTVAQRILSGDIAPFGGTKAPAVSEADIQETMRIHNVSREEVLKRIGL